MKKDGRLRSILNHNQTSARIHSNMLFFLCLVLLVIGLFSHTQALYSIVKNVTETQPAEVTPTEAPEEIARTRASILALPSRDVGWRETSVCGGVGICVLSGLVILVSLGDVAATIVGCITERTIDKENTGRFAAMVIMLVSLVFSNLTAIYAIVGVAKKRATILHATGVALAVIMVIQLVVILVGVQVTNKEQQDIEVNVERSFYRYQHDTSVANTRDVVVWEAAQKSGECCGLYGPEDFAQPRSPKDLAPEVPSACCPFFKNSNSTDEHQRRLCIQTHTYYQTGCKRYIVNIFLHIASNVVVVSSVLLGLELLLTILSAYLSYQRKLEKNHGVDIDIIVLPTKKTGNQEATTTTK